MLYYEITTIIILIQSNAKTIKGQKPSQETARLLEVPIFLFSVCFIDNLPNNYCTSMFQENKQNMEQLQPKVAELRELMSQMKDAEGVDPKEYSQLRSELNDFDVKMETLNEDIDKEEKRYDTNVVEFFSDNC